MMKDSKLVNVRLAMYKKNLRLNRIMITEIGLIVTSVFFWGGYKDCLSIFLTSIVNLNWEQCVIAESNHTHTHTRLHIVERRAISCVVGMPYSAEPK